MTMRSVVSVHAAATAGALSWFKSESSFPIFWLVPAFKKQFQISRFFFQKGHIAPTTPASNNLGALMAKHGSHRPISPATQRRQLAPGSAAEEQTGRYAKDQGRAARGPQSWPQLRHVFNHSLFDGLVYHRKQARYLPSA